MQTFLEGENCTKAEMDVDSKKKPSFNFPALPVISCLVQQILSGDTKLAPGLEELLGRQKHKRQHDAELFILSEIAMSSEA